MKGECPKCGGVLIVTTEFIGCDKCKKVFYNEGGYSAPKIKATKIKIQTLAKQIEMDFNKN